MPLPPLEPGGVETRNKPGTACGTEDVPQVRVASSDSLSMGAAARWDLPPPPTLHHPSFS